MKKMSLVSAFLILLPLLFVAVPIFMLTSTKAEDISFEPQSDIYFISEIGGEKEEETLKGIWLTQFDMTVLYRDGNRQREKEDFKQKAENIIKKISDDGFNTIFLQVRPNGDSVYESEIYPTSKYIAGKYGGETEYDAVEIFLKTAKKYGLSVHAWINPYRASSEAEILTLNEDEPIKALYKKGILKKGGDGLLYLDPSYPETTDIIVAGAKEILEKYGFDGIHLDDYFYPTEFELDDEKEFKSSGYTDKGEFRRNNTDRTVKALHEVCHEYGKTFGISPAGNIYSLTDGWYIDIYKWISEAGYVDYIMPQLYYGFDNAVCPFEKILYDWEKSVTADIKLYIGLSAAKCCIGSEGGEDKYAGENGKYEWRDNKDILAREIECINKSEKSGGYCLFSCGSLYNMLTATDNTLIAEEKVAFANIIKQ